LDLPPSGKEDYDVRHLQMMVCAIGTAMMALGQGTSPPATPPGIAWQAEFETALDLAKKENKPIMVAFVMIDEPANDEIMRHHFKNPEIIAESRKFVCMVGCRGMKEAEEGIRVDGTKGRVSVQLGSADPAEIERVEACARAAFVGTHSISAPQFIFLAPDGERVLLRHVWMLSEHELLRKIRLAYAFHDPASAPEDFRKQADDVTRLMAEADDNNSAKRLAALTTLAGIDDPRVTEFLIRQTGPRADKAKRLEAIQRMGARGNAKVLDCLHALLKINDNMARIHTAISLGAIGMRESAEHLEKALKKENKDRVRCHILRALSTCHESFEDMEPRLLSGLESNSQLDQVTALYLCAAALDPVPSDKLKRMILRKAQDTNTRVRCAAFYAIGTLSIQEARPLLERTASSLRGDAQACCQWAISLLGGTTYEGDVDPASLVLQGLPDTYLYSEPAEVR
jgi:hypothetical protein